jgi:hypothetical protein
MSKRAFKSQASSSRVVPTGFGPSSTSGGASVFGAAPASTLSYVYEPPDLSAIGDADVQRIFKSLQKRDSTTKAKALEDLQGHVSKLETDGNLVEEAILEAWIRLYPRTSIDNSRRVRQLAHWTQGQLAAACGKRIAKHMPSVAGAWLCGLRDNDKTVSRAAYDAFSKVFSSADKQRGVWRAFQAPILEYCRDAILNETVQTLSDERTTTPDDAESKYARVIATALLTTANAIEALDLADIKQEQELYSEIVEAKAVWRFAAYQDAFVRRAVFRLLQANLEKLPESIDYTSISNYVLQDGLNSNQSGSANEYIKTLLYLTKTQPSVWTEHYKGSGKKSATRRLSSFLKKGSQGSPTEFWVNLSKFLHDVPIEALIPPAARATEASPETAEEVFAVLVALQHGVTRKEEFRPSQNEAWKAYLQLAARILTFNETSQAQISTICKEHVLPLVRQYVRPVPENASWNIAGQPLEVSTLAAMVALRASSDMVAGVLDEVSAEIVQDMQLSLPEQSKDYDKSQENVIAETERWYSFQANWLKTSRSEELQLVLSKLTRNETSAAIAIAKNRNGKPYCAAASLAEAVATVPQLTIENDEAKKIILDFAENAIPSLTTSPSSPYLLRLLDLLSSVDSIEDIYASCLTSLVDAPEGSGRDKALARLLSSSWPNDTRASDILCRIFKDSLENTLHGQEDAWPIASAALVNRSMPPFLVNEILGILVEGLSVDNKASPSMRGLETLARYNEQALREFVASKDGTPLLAKLLFLSHEDTGDEGDLVTRATKLKTTIDSLISNGKFSNVASGSMVKIIRQGIQDVSATALPVHTLVEQAKKLLHEKKEEELDSLLKRLLPDEELSGNAISPFFSESPTPSLALTNKLGGAVYLVSSPATNQDSDATAFDAEGLSPLFRLASFIVDILQLPGVWDSLPFDDRISHAHFLAVYNELSYDRTFVRSRKPLWDENAVKFDVEILSMVLQQQRDIRDFVLARIHNDQGYMEAMGKVLMDYASEDGVQAYYNARAYTTLCIESSTVFSAHEQDTRLASIKRSQYPVADTAYLAGVDRSSAALKVLNELLSSLTSRRLSDDPQDSLQKLVPLNRLLNTYAGKLDDVPQQRLVFFVKHVAASLRSSYGSQPLLAESLKVVAYIVPAIQELYGEFWLDLVEILISVLDSNDSMVMTSYCALHLCSVLRSLANKASNDDVEEAWADKEVEVANSMLALLSRACEAEDESTNEPHKIMTRLLANELQKMSTKIKGASLDLYKPLSSSSSSLQQAAYSILHQQIPAEQEQISLDAALEAEYVPQLPEDLLAIITQSSSLDPEEFISLRNATEIPAPFTRLLLSWKLVFDHWTNASYTVQGHYVTQIKSGEQIDQLLSFLTEILIYRRGAKATVNASRFDLTTYTLDEESFEGVEYNSQWLLSHVYYLTLLHLPSLVKSWWRTSCPRYLERPVEEWTEKYISPAVIAAELSTLAEWQPNPDDTTEMEVRTSRKAREVIALYPVDENQMSIHIVLPPAYPLHSVAVTTGQRVAVDEKKWASWLNTTNIAINFSSTSQGLGCVIDGLVAWRKNVTGSLKGQSECAICYSIVGADKQLPSKRCGTCKNMFHGACLFRWFKSSSSSSCPLCRNAFNYA